MVLVVTISSDGAISAKNIVSKSDKIRNIGKSFYQKCYITSYINAKKSESMEVSIYSKISQSSGQYRTLVRITKPKKDKNKIIMRQNKKLWLYDPNSKASIQISPRQRLLGQTSNGDVMTSNFSLDYKARLIKSEKIKGGDKKMHNCYLLELKAHNSDVSYPFIEYWVEKKSFRPIRGKFYTAGKKLLKDVYYRKYRSVMGATRPTEVLIFDGFSRNKATKMKFSGARSMSIPDFWFRRSYLPKFSGK